MNGRRPLKREFALAILFGADGNLLLQQRDNKPGILFPGRISLFGGHREGNETASECVRRELGEETGLNLAPERFEVLFEYETRYPDGSGVRAAFYIVRDAPTDNLTINEGTLVVVPLSEVALLLARMTPATCFAIKTLLDLDDGRD